MLKNSLTSLDSFPRSSNKVFFSPVIESTASFLLVGSFNLWALDILCARAVSFARYSSTLAFVSTALLFPLFAAVTASPCLSFFSWSSSKILRCFSSAFAANSSTFCIAFLACVSFTNCLIASCVWAYPSLSPRANWAWPSSWSFCNSNSVFSDSRASDIAFFFASASFLIAAILSLILLMAALFIPTSASSAFLRIAVFFLISSPSFADPFAAFPNASETTSPDSIWLPACSKASW